MTDKLRAAAQALVDRWDSPRWAGSAENLRHTGEYIADLRAALADERLSSVIAIPITEPVQPAKPAEQEPVADLKERCAEILAWQKTGILHGEALRQYANRLYGDDQHALQLAAAQTARDAYEWITGALAEQPAEQASVRAMHIGWDYLDNGTLVATYAVPVPEQIAPKLYTAPQPAIPPGYKLVPLNRSYDMRVQALLAFNSSKGDRDDALQDAWQAMLNAAPEAPQPDMQPLLVRDLAELIGSTVPAVCKALEDLGTKPRRSTNAAVTPDEALAVARRLAQPAKRVQLTDEDIEQAAARGDGTHSGLAHAVIAAYERKNGITGEQN